MKVKVQMPILRTPKRLRKDNFNLENYIERAAILDIKYGYYDRNDYLAQQPAYIAKREELLKQMNEEKDKE